MRAAAIAALLVSGLVVADYRSPPQGVSLPRGCRDRSCVRSRTDSSPSAPPVFSFVASGTACSGAAQSGITFTRASSRTCLKGAEASGIANGDMVTLSTDQIAVQPGGDGTGALGISSWEERTNTVLQSQAFDNVAWTGFGDFLPTVTANAVVAPDGTLTAERVTFHSTSAAQRTLLFQGSVCTNGMSSLSTFMRGICPDGGSICTAPACVDAGVGPCGDGGFGSSCGDAGVGVCEDAGFGTMDLAFLDAANGWVNRACSFVSDSWTRCEIDGISIAHAGASGLFSLGNMSSTNGGTARGTSDVGLWGAQCEAGRLASPYIPTTAASVTRAADIASATYTAAGATVSLGATYTPANITADDTATMSMSFSATNETTLGVLGAKDKCRFKISSTDTYLNGPATFTTPASSTASCDYTSGSLTSCSGGSCNVASGSLTLPTGAATLYIGRQIDGGAANGTVKAACADPSATKCRQGSVTTCASAESATVAAFGDSIMVGAFEIKVVNQLNDSLCPTRAAVSYAVSGATISDCADQYHNSIKGHAYRAAMTNCGTNDLLGGSSAATAWAAMESLLQDVTRDGGFTVVLGNITPCGGYPTCDDAKVQAFNASEANWCADAGSRAVCLDNYTLLKNATQVRFDTSFTDYMGSLCLPSSDNLHPNNYCTTLLGQTFAAAVP